MPLSRLRSRLRVAMAATAVAGMIARTLVEADQVPPAPEAGTWGLATIPTDPAPSAPWSLLVFGVGVLLLASSVRGHLRSRNRCGFDLGTRPRA